MTEDRYLELYITGSELADILEMFAIDLMMTLAPQTGDEKLEALSNHLLDTANMLSAPGPRKAVLLALAQRLIKSEGPANP